MTPLNRLSDYLLEKQAQGLYRQRELLAGPQGVRVNITGREYLSFCSNDYLGLANDPDLIAALKQGADQFGVGAGAAHLISGHTQLHQELEQALAAHVGRSRALLFSTGYMANLGLLTSLAQKGDLVLQDKLNHASLIDGGLYAAAQFKRYRHADMSHLASCLNTSNVANKFIVTDGIFSMDGDIAPLPEIMRLAREYNAVVIVDDAHGLGVLGETGGGVCQQFNLMADDAPIIMGTLGKAFGVSGAFVAGSETLIEYLIQTARTYIYTTAMPACLAAASLCSLQKIQTEAWRRTHLQSLIQQFRDGCAALELSLMESHTPIQPLVLGDEGRALQWSQVLKEQGILVKAIRPPTVAKGTARLRITLSATHTADDVNRLLNALGELR